MFIERDVQYMRERRKDSMTFARKQRLIQAAMAAHPSFVRRYEQWLVRFGVRLVAWGTRLQNRYAGPAIRHLAMQRK